MKQLLDYFRRSLNGRSAVHQGVRMAGIYCRGEKHYVATSSQTREGFWVEESPASVLKLEDTAGLN